MIPGKTTNYILALCGTLTCVATLHAAEDWPMHRGDASRSAYTSNELPTKLRLSWKRVPKHRPSPAWSAQPRLQYDHTYHPVCYDGLLFFGSSTDHRVYALDASTGTAVWTFFTDAPIRVAPAVCEHGVYVGGDDGVLYCLDVKSGRLRWKIRAAGQDDRIMGNDRLISRWPIRGGPVIRDGAVYFAAGIWPTEGTHVYAVDAQSGHVIWKNDTCGSLISNKPRAGRDVRSGPAAQGHLAVGEGILVVPTGRAAPAVFDLSDGSLKYFHHALHVNKASGGTKVAVFDDLVVFGENYPSPDFRGTRTRICTATEGANVATSVSAVHANHPRMIITATSSELLGFDRRWAENERRDREGNVEKYLSLPRDTVWKCAAPFPVRDLIATDKALVVAGDDRIAMIDIDGGRVVGRVRVDAKVQSLAVANRCVYAADEEGAIYCFSEDGGSRILAAETKQSAADSEMAAVQGREILARLRLKPTDALP